MAISSLAATIKYLTKHNFGIGRRLLETDNVNNVYISVPYSRKQATVLRNPLQSEEHRVKALDLSNESLRQILFIQYSVNTRTSSTRFTNRAIVLQRFS